MWKRDTRWLSGPNFMRRLVCYSLQGIGEKSMVPGAPSYMKRGKPEGATSFVICAPPALVRVFALFSRYGFHDVEVSPVTY